MTKKLIERPWELLSIKMKLDGLYFSCFRILLRLRAILEAKSMFR